MAALAARLTVNASGALAVGWPAAGVVALWGLIVRSRREAFVASAILIAVLYPVEVMTGINPFSAGWLAASNLVLFVGVRGLHDVLRHQSIFRASEDFPAWEVQDAWQATRVFTSAVAAVVVSTPVAMVSFIIAGREVTGDDAVSYVIRNLAPIVLLTGTAVTLLSRDQYVSRISPRVLAGASIASALLAPLIFSPSIHISLGQAVAIPLFWVAVRNPPWMAMLFTLGVMSIMLLLLLTVGVTPIGIGLSLESVAARFQVLCITTGTLTFIISLAMEQVTRLAATLASSERRVIGKLNRMVAITETVPDGLAVYHSNGLIEPLNNLTDGYLWVDAHGTYHLPAAVHTLDGLPLVHEQRPAVRALDGEESRDVPLVVPQENGPPKIFEISASPLVTQAGVRAALISFREATSRYEALAARDQIQADLAYQAGHDSLTGLVNRAGFERALREAVADFEQEGTDCGILLIDLDHFKNLNDSHGHAAGDQLLTSLAKELTQALRHTDVVARIGGDEFAILLPHTGLVTAQHVARSLVQRVTEATQVVPGDRNRVTASIGVVSLATADQLGRDPLVLADMLMYDAKDSGRNRSVSIDPVSPQTPQMGLRMEIHQRIEHALVAGAWNCTSSRFSR